MTQDLRKNRVNEKKFIRELNDISSRLIWVRKKLKVTQSQIAENCGIPASTYNYRESGVRTTNYEEFACLSEYFNRIWKAKFKDGFPLFEEKELTQITILWILFGTNSDHEAAEIYNKEIISNFYEEKTKLTEEIANLYGQLHQLSLFDQVK